MKKMNGSPSSRIWLLGDSAPEKRGNVAHPLDARHPTRHSIWTPVLESIQEVAFAVGRAGQPLRVRSDAFFAINAVHLPEDRPSAYRLRWDGQAQELAEFRRLASEHRPALILSFGAFAFEFARRSIESGKPQRIADWTVKLLGTEFSKRAGCGMTTLVPLLHATVARGKWHHCHEVFAGAPAGEAAPTNYFQFTGTALGQRLVEHHADEDIWVR